VENYFIGTSVTICILHNMCVAKAELFVQDWILQ
jgi:hypothetical protein